MKNFQHQLLVYKPDQLGSCVKIANDKKLLAEGIGNIKIRGIVNVQIFEHELTRLLYVPDFKRNLFSIGVVNDTGFSFHCYYDKCEICNENREIRLLGTRHGTLFRMLFDVILQPECNLSESVMLWHERMGHANVKSLFNTAKVFQIEDLPKNICKIFCVKLVLSLSKQENRMHLCLKKEIIFIVERKLTLMCVAR